MPQSASSLNLEESKDDSKADGTLTARSSSTRHGAIAAAREHLSVVVQELEALTQGIDEDNSAGRGKASRAQSRVQSRAQSKVAGASVALSADEDAASDGNVAGPGSEFHELHARLRHMEVDLDVARERAKRLEAENKALVDAQAALEAQLQNTQQTLEETQRRLKHRELDLRRAKGLPPGGTDQEHGDDADKASTQLTPKSQDMLRRHHSTVPTTSTRYDDLSPRVQPKQQLVAALKIAQAQLRLEKDKRKALSTKMKQDTERFERLGSIAEKQRDELRASKQHCRDVQEYAAECERRLKRVFLKTTSLHAALHGVDELEGDLGPPVGGFAGMNRQHSAPTLQLSPATKLPAVVPARG